MAESTGEPAKKQYLQPGSLVSAWTVNTSTSTEENLEIKKEPHGSMMLAEL